jgi:hypothetical protein
MNCKIFTFGSRERSYAGYSCRGRMSDDDKLQCPVLPVVGQDQAISNAEE